MIGTAIPRVAAKGHEEVPIRQRQRATLVLVEGGERDPAPVQAVSDIDRPSGQDIPSASEARRRVASVPAGPAMAASR